MNALANIRKAYRSLTKTNKKIADYILYHSDDVVSQTAAEIGEASGVSPASVVRFVKKIGFSGLDELKVQLASEQAALTYQREIDPIVSSEDTLAELCGKVDTLFRDTVTDVFAMLDLEKLQAAIDGVKRAKNIYLFGIGASSLVAYDLFHKFSRAGKRASFVFDTHIGIELLSYAQPQDVVIAVTYSGHTKEILLACEYARQKQAHLIIITRNNSEKLQQLADELLLVPDNEHLLRIGAISSLYASMLVGTVLYLGSIQEQIDDQIEEKMIITKNWVSPLKEE